MEWATVYKGYWLLVIFGCCDLFDYAVLRRKEGRNEDMPIIEYYSIDSFIRFAYVINYLLILGGKEGPFGFNNSQIIIEIDLFVSTFPRGVTGRN